MPTHSRCEWSSYTLHTQLPLIHWLPKRQRRMLFRILGYEFFADEANLNLMSRSDLKTIAQQFGNYLITVRDRKLLGWPSNLFLIGQRLAH